MYFIIVDIPPTFGIRARHRPIYQEAFEGKKLGEKYLLIFNVVLYCDRMLAVFST
jgi:hypothetical protein